MQQAEKNNWKRYPSRSSNLYRWCCADIVKLSIVYVEDEIMYHIFATKKANVEKP